MLSDVQIRAPAKVNIGLRVLPKRDDGFHSIESIFQTVDFADDLSLNLLKEDGLCKVDCAQMELPAENTITAAYRAFCRLTGKHAGVQVKLTKRIPAGGGLGGGSSDAASFIKAYAALTGTALSPGLADAVASEVGSDVFFFLHCGEKGGAALVSGRGEVVRPIVPRNDLHFVLVLPDVHSSTKEAYALVDKALEAGDSLQYPPLEKLESVYRGPIKKWSFANTFTPALTYKYSAIADALADVRKSGAVWADMTGSGAVVFGVYDSAVSAESACNLLHETWGRCVLA